MINPAPIALRWHPPSVNATATVLLLVAALAAVTDWIAVATDRRPVEYVAKPATMAALVAVAITLDCGGHARGPARALVIAAGLLSLAGDVFLMLPRDRFVPGLASFLAAHLAYIGALVAEGATAGRAALAALPVLVAALLIGRPIVAAVRRSEDGAELLAPVVVYMAVISAMLVAALATGNPLAAAGALLFFASDGTLAWDRFVRPLPSGRLLVMMTYHLAQAGLVLALTR